MEMALNDDFSRSNEIDDIPIFTDLFLEHNRKRETELRNLKKMTTDCEENVSMLEKHIDDMNATIDILQNEIDKKKKSNADLYHYLELAKTLLYEEFKSMPIPGTNELATPQTILTYINKLQINYKPKDNNDLVKQKITNVITKLEESIKF